MATPMKHDRGRFLHATLDAIFPGLGHLVAGRRGLALLFGLPVLAIVVLLLVVLLTTSGVRLAATLLDPAVLVGLLAVQGLLLVWRLIAVGSSLWDPRLLPPGRRDALPIVGILLVAVIAPHSLYGFSSHVD
jgi:hypothetical protein